MSDGLVIRGLNKRFGGIVVADEIDLELPPGKVVGLIGPNGAGKTSLFNLVSGVVRQDSGRVSLGGVALDRLPTYRRARLGLVRTWQNLRLFPSLSVLDNLLIGARDYPAESLATAILRPGRARRAGAAERAHALDVLRRTALLDLADAPVQRVPFGQQKLIGVARALMNRPRCLLMDEPMAGVEAKTYSIVQSVVRDLAAGGIAICVVEHNVGFIRDLCDEGVFMFAGRVLARGPVGDIIADPRLTDLYFGT
jgi:branched-chain amino acid transport system ATP-binding protein